MKNVPPSQPSRRDQGVALVLVLCFVVLITGLVVAYFSRTLTTRQLSNASTSTTQAEMLANSATDVILSDLKQEIANGSIASTPPPAAPGAFTAYVPAQAAYAVPQRNVTTGGVDQMPNLVRRSLRRDASGKDNAFPSPVPSPVSRPAPSSRASEAASDKPSINGRYISRARWNRHYLLPTGTPAPSAAPGSSPSPSDPTTPLAAFTAPDWVYVTAEKGPDVLAVAKPFTDESGVAVTPTGRYAYAIYDEGGLLDINHTGYPSASLLSPTGITHVGAKPAPSYADLTQLPLPSPGSTASPAPVAMTAPTVDNLLGWRHYATLQATGTFPGLVPSSASADTAYYNFFTANTVNPTANSTSLLQVPPTLWNNKTDQMFLSRQQLINYFAAANLDPRYLQYLSTFSRSLNQPSYLPEHSVTSIEPADTTDPAARRPVLAQGQGGNDAYGVVGISANFLAARVLTAFPRYDGTTAIVGEPLVKKRFPLNRLAWLTYRGPSSTRDTSTTALNGPDADIGFLKQYYGITKEWLDQGTPDRVATYFGLKWDPITKWTYIHGSNGTNGSILNVYNLTKSTDVARQVPGREPDFFELLKAAINPGSIAKTSLDPAIKNDSLTNAHAAQDQYLKDISVDTAIFQIGANIIDQFDTDGFPTQIHYDRSGSGLAAGLLPAVCGDENVPYISRVRSGLLHLVESNPIETLVDPGTDPKPGTDPVTGLPIPVPVPVKDTGVGALMAYPEIWNMHDWSATNATTLAQSVGAVAPANFKVYATTNPNGGNPLATTVFVWNQPLGHNSMDADVSKSPGFASLYHFNFGTPGSNQGGETRYLSEKNAKLTFTIDPTSATSEALFREPTILYTPGIPTGSQLASPVLTSANTGTPDGLGSLAQNPTFFLNNGLVSSAGTPAGSAINIPRQGAAYIGFYIGAHPLRWWDDNTLKPYKATDTTGLTGPRNFPVYQTQFGPVNDVIYTLACEDGSGGWIPYDVKPITTTGAPDCNLYTSTDSCFGFNGWPDKDFGLRYYLTIDPRTARFGMIDPWINNNYANSIPPRRNYSVVNLAQGVLKPDREGVNSGIGLNLVYLSGNYFTTNMGWYSESKNSLLTHDTYRPGLLSQNNPNVRSDGMIPITNPLADPSNSSGPFYPFYYADADGVVRRASAGNVDVGKNSPPAPAATTVGLPMAYATGTSAANSSGTVGPKQMDSRPSILNRPFRSVAELGYVYSGTPWKNLNFFLPESGDSALLDVFCINDNSDSNALTAGQVNLNTHQVPVLQAILAQTSKDQWNDAIITAATKILGTGTPSGLQAQQLAQLLVTRTVVGPATGPNADAGPRPQPLQNIGDLVGRWVKPKPVSTGFGGIDGNASCDGFTADIATFLAAPGTSDVQMHNIQRIGESAVRTLANAGQTRVWNLMFDIVAQTGRFPAQADTLDKFNVEGEQHYWVHVAIDRYTGQILDKQVEVVKE